MPLTLRQLVERIGEGSFTYMEQEFKFEYRVDKLTKEFRATALRLNREVLKSERRLQALLEVVNLVVAPDGSIEAETEDENARIALQQIVDNDERLKHEIDEAIAEIVHKWELEDENHRMVPLTKTDEHGNVVPSDELFKVPSDFEGRILSTILLNSQGEASGATPSNLSHLPSKQAAKPVTSRPSQTSTHTSKRRTGSHR